MKLEKRQWSVIILFFVMQALIIVRNILVHQPNYFFYYCDYVPLLFALILLWGDEQMFKALISVGLLSQIFYFIDIFLSLYAGNSVLGLYDGFNSGFLYAIIPIFIHTSSIFALALTYKSKPQLKSFYYALIIVLFIYTSTIVFTSPTDNVNAVFGLDGGIININIPHYTLFWPILAVILVVLPTYGIEYLMYEFSVIKSRKKK